MTDKSALKQRVCETIDRHHDDICALGEDIRLHPELGFKEFRTSLIVAKTFCELGIDHETGIAVTGVKGKVKGGSEGPTVAYMGELDSVLVRDHPDANPETGAAHACGHNAQIANLIGLAYGLAESGVMQELAGNVALIAVPAEEYVEVAYRTGLRKAGKIEFLGGKPEFVRLGALDDVAITMMTHQAGREDPGKFSVGGPSNGCVVKQIRFEGKAAHAGGAPHSGINALKAAMLALQAIDANRETFKDDDHIRVHPIITKGGELVNVIPADVRMETYVRGASVDAILAAAEKVDRSLKSGAMAMGAQVHIESLPGYLPRIVCDDLVKVYQSNVVGLYGEEGWWEPSFGAGSTDMGDLSHIMPAMEAQANGASGTGHGADYAIADPDVAYVAPAKLAAMTLIDLLADGAKEANGIVERFEPAMAKEQYLEFARGLFQNVTWPESE